ncbi:MAG TPA: cofactor-independent phosphoglycerate mutase [Bacteroidaceae bacterium]|nr:cofactor-independent phosphoglycerate mutase [Bacteroidaceae bacterium]
MKYLIILGDGMADWPIEAFEGRTILQNAKKPYMDMLAAKGRNGLFKSVPDGFLPGSEVANLSVLGYDVASVFEGRGVLEAANMGVDIQPGELGMRCNLICVDNGLIKNHSAGHISTAEAAELMEFLQRELGDERTHFYSGVQYRHLLVLKGGDKRLICTPPHDVPMKPFMPLIVKAEVDEALDTAQRLNNLILNSMSILPSHSVNIKRAEEGKDMANCIWPWSPGYRPNMTKLSDIYPFIKESSVISAVDLIKGIGYYAGMKIIDVEGATGMFDTNYSNKAKAAVEALRSDDLVYVHVEAPDEAGHEGDCNLKNRTVEDLDRLLVGPIFESIKDWQTPVAIAILPDHPTPCALRTHTSDPVPFLIYYPGIEPDSVKVFDEISCKEGSLGTMSGAQFMNFFLSKK